MGLGDYELNCLATAEDNLRRDQSAVTCLARKHAERVYERCRNRLCGIEEGRRASHPVEEKAPWRSLVLGRAAIAEALYIVMDRTLHYGDWMEGMVIGLELESALTKLRLALDNWEKKQTL